MHYQAFSQMRGVYSLQGPSSGDILYCITVVMLARGRLYGMSICGVYIVEYITTIIILGYINIYKVYMMTNYIFF